MNYKVFSVALLCAAIALPVRSQCIPRDEKVEAQVEALLAKMSLRDKVGQMCELTFDKVAHNPMAGNASPTLAGGMLSADAVNEVFSQYRVGSILNVPFDIAQTPEVWSDIIRTLNQASLEQCGVPQIYGVDQIHGASYTFGATLFPQEVGQGSSFNIAIPRRIGDSSLPHSMGLFAGDGLGPFSALASYVGKFWRRRAAEWRDGFRTDTRPAGREP